jgi:hypothetical protein
MKDDEIRCRIVRLPGYIEQSVSHILINVGMGSVQTYLGDIVGSVPDHSNTASYTNYLVSQCI